MEIEQHADRTRLIVRGPVRLGEVQELLDSARAADALGRDIELDLAAAEHMHVAAWQVLRALERSTLQRGQCFRATDASETALAMLELLNLGAWLVGTEGGA
jgi:ABC-type transporter Mla MlaB component